MSTVAEILEKIIDVLVDKLHAERGVDKTELKNAIENARNSGGDTSDIERLFNA